MLLPNLRICIGAADEHDVPIAICSGTGTLGPANNFTVIYSYRYLLSEVKLYCHGPVQGPHNLAFSERSNIYCVLYSWRFHLLVCSHSMWVMVSMM